MIWENRSITPLVPKSGEQEDQMDPIAEVAINDSTVSIRFGKYAATLSFSFNLIDLKKTINLSTFLFNSFQVLFFLIQLS